MTKEEEKEEYKKEFKERILTYLPIFILAIVVIFHPTNNYWLWLICKSYCSIAFIIEGLIWLFRKKVLGLTGFKKNINATIWCLAGIYVIYKSSIISIWIKLIFK